MNKKEFLQRLSNGLDLLDEVERREIIGFYEERFHSGTVYEGKSEEEVVADLESPETIARNVLEEYGINTKYIKTKEQRYNHIDNSQVIGVALFDVFIASWLLPAVVSITFALFATLVSYVAVVPLIIGEHTIADQYMFWFLTAGYVLLFFIALAILDLSIGLIKKIFIWHLNAFKFNNREKWIKKLSKVSVDRLLKTSGTVKFLKSILIIGSIVTIGYTGYHLFLGNNQYFASYTNVQEQTDEYTIPVTITDEWTIITELGSVSVKLMPTDRDDIHVSHTYTDKQNFEIVIDETDQSITMTQDFRNIGFFNFGDLISWLSGGNEIIIEVPEELLFDTLNIAIMNGDFEIENFTVDSLSVDVTNGKIIVDQLILDSNTELDVNNGSIYVYDTISSDGVSMATINGNIIVKNVVFDDYNFDVENGKIKLDDLNTDLQDGQSINAKTTNGSIELNNVYVRGVSLRTTNGSIDYFNDDTSYVLDDLDVETVNGSYEGNVRD
jgi:uncharacterized membrane protein